MDAVDMLCPAHVGVERKQFWEWWDVLLSGRDKFLVQGR